VITVGTSRRLREQSVALLMVAALVSAACSSIDLPDQVTAKIPLGGALSAVIVHDGRVYVADGDTIVAVEVDDLSRTKSAGSGGAILSLAADADDGDVLWAVDAERDVVLRVDSSSLAVVDEVEVPGASVIAVGLDAAWVTSSEDGSLSKLDLDTSRLQWTREVGDFPVGVATGAGAVWIADAGGDAVLRVDPDSGEVTATTPVGRFPAALAAGEGAVWVANEEDDTVSRIDIDDREVTATVEVGDRPVGIAVGEGAVWVANSGDGTITRLARGDGEPSATIEVGTQPLRAAAGAGAVWVVDRRDGTLLRLS
jgi:YVTN family beta-propeller protein